ncbi:hypothetical protein B0H11DRAFT_1917737 [Mycena galericulata]|nr:hypothetical protein B0H11DRAFT_1917737 [Mycena galericulata]
MGRGGWDESGAPAVGTLGDKWGKGRSGDEKGLQRMTDDGGGKAGVWIMENRGDVETIKFSSEVGKRPKLNANRNENGESEGGRQRGLVRRACPRQSKFQLQAWLEREGEISVVVESKIMPAFAERNTCC